MKRVMITGATGMIGKIILRQCLESAEISEVITLGRKQSGIQHARLKEIIHDDFSDYSAIESLFEGIDITWFCIGVYTGAAPDQEFKKITVDYTAAFADTLKRKSPHAVFCFFSGAGADRSEKSRIPFARYKGMAENHLFSKQFDQLYIFRPSYIYPVEKRKEPNLGYRIYRMLYPLVRLLGKRFSIRSTDLGEVMFRAGMSGTEKKILENSDILKLVGHS